MHYFELYELPIGMAKDKNALKSRYYRLSRQYHPDYYEQHATISPAENLRLSAMVNEGYALLKDDYATLGYILSLKGVLQKEEKYQLPPDFLMEMMELNEDLDAVAAADIHRLQGEIKAPVAALLEQDNMDLLREEQLLALKEYYFKEKYLRRILDRINGVPVED